MGADTSGVDQFKQTLREMGKFGEGGAALAEILQQRSESRSREGTRVVSLEDGTGNALSARVNADNNLGTEARFGRTSTVMGDDTVTTTSQELIAIRAGRLTFTIQNLDDAIAIYFHVGSGIATTSSLRLGPGQMYSPPPGVAFEGPLSFITAAGSAQLAWVEYLAGG